MCRTLLLSLSKLVKHRTPDTGSAALPHGMMPSITSRLRSESRTGPFHSYGCCRLPSPCRSKINLPRGCCSRAHDSISEDERSPTPHYLPPGCLSRESTSGFPATPVRPTAALLTAVARRPADLSRTSREPCSGRTQNGV